MKNNLLRFTALALVLLSLGACAKPTSTNSGKITGDNTPNFAGATQSMYQPDYWINKIKKPDELVMTREAIVAYNNSMVDSKTPNYYNIDNYPETIDRDTLNKALDTYGVPGGERTIGGEPMTQADRRRLTASQNKDAVAEQNTVRFGIVVKETGLKDFPTEEIINGEDGRDFDVFFESKLKVWEKVAILHTSKDRKWYYIQGAPYQGWIKAEDVAVTTKENLQKYNNSNALIVTGNRLILDYDFDSSISRTEMLMGTRLPIADKPADIEGVSTQSSHVVVLPVRSSTGMLEEKLARVPMSADVSLGYLPYTEKNVINQAYKMLGERYGWGGSMNARDCSSYLRDIFFTFGIELPRNSGSQINIPSKGKVDLSQMSEQEKEQAIMKMQPGAILGFPGHVMMYLGSENGKAYVIHDVYAFGDSGKAGEGGRRVVNCVTVSDLHVTRKDGTTMLANLKTVTPVG